MFFWEAASAADSPAGNGIKTHLTNRASTLLVNGKTAVTNGLRKLRNPPSWLIILITVPF